MTHLQIFVKQDTLSQLETREVFENVVADSELLEIFDLGDEIENVVSSLAIDIIVVKIQFFELVLVLKRIADHVASLVSQSVHLKADGVDVLLLPQ